MHPHVCAEGDKKPVPFSGTLKGRGCEPRPAKIAKATDGKKERRKAAEAPHEPTPGDPEGTNCKKSDMAKGCECAGKFWRCADKDDLITKACDIGLECVRKNEFYAVRVYLFVGTAECICWDCGSQNGV